MSYPIKLLSLITGLGLLAGLATLPARGEGPEKAGTGTVTGTVLDQDQKPVAGAMVAIVDRAAAKKARDDWKADGGKAEGGKPEDRAAGEGRKGRNKMPEPFAKAETDADGKFALGDVPAGEYVVVARLKGTGRGMERVTVMAGEEHTVAVTLSPPGERKGKGDRKGAKADNADPAKN